MSTMSTMSTTVTTQPTTTIKAPVPTTTVAPSATTTRPIPMATASADDERCAGTTTSTVTTPDYTVPGYVPPLPDAAGNPPCPLPSIWNTAVSGAGISVFASRDPTAVTVTVRKKSGVDESQSATIKPGQSLHQFDFPRVDKSSVAEVLAFSVNDGSRCYVTVF